MTIQRRLLHSWYYHELCTRAFNKASESRTKLIKLSSFLYGLVNRRLELPFGVSLQELSSYGHDYFNRADLKNNFARPTEKVILQKIGKDAVTHFENNHDITRIFSCIVSKQINKYTTGMPDPSTVLLLLPFNFIKQHQCSNPSKHCRILFRWIFRPGADPGGGAIGAIAPLKTYKNNFIHRHFAQCKKQHLRYKAILTSIVMSQKCCEVYFICLTIVNP